MPGKENKFYVYVHRRGSCGSIFYVGMGCKGRAWQISGRNKHWVSVYNKHGRDVEVCQEKMSRDDACLLEKWLISKLRHQKEKLTNITDGGDGCSGKVLSRDERIRASRIKGGMPVYCSDGRVFDSASGAALVLSDEMGKPCFPAAILACCKAGHGSAYGRGWSYNEGGCHDFAVGAKNICLKVSSSDGMSFDSIVDAAAYTSKRIGKNADPSSISKAAKSTKRSAYGLKWAMGSDPQDARNKLCEEFKIIRGGGKKYRDVKAAAEDIFNCGLSATVNSARSAISACISNKTLTAYSFSWERC